MSSKENKYEIIKEKTILVGGELKKKGDLISSSQLNKERLKQFVKEGILLAESDAKKLKKELEEAKKDSSASLEKVKEMEKAIAIVQSELVKEKEAFEKEKEDFKAEKEAFEKEKEELKK